MSKTAKSTVTVLAVLALIIGVVWIGQGTGYFPYPRASFMIDQTPWAWRGAGLAAAAVVVIVLLRRK